jgi:hypothetical protein
VTGRWFYPDGVAAGSFDIPLPAAVEPDRGAELRAHVAAPQRPGAYRLMFDLHEHDHGYASAAPSVRANESVVAVVTVTGSPFQAVDLDEVRNVVAITNQARRDRGRFDRRGASYPAELFPPDAISGTSVMVPCGYFLGERDSGERTPFLMPRTVNGMAEAVACDGQQVALPALKAARLHLLMAGSSANAEGAFAVSYADGQTRETLVPVTMWTREPRHGEHVCLAGRYLHLPLGRIESLTCRMFHYTIELRPDAELAALQLPVEQEIKLFAATIEASGG